MTGQLQKGDLVKIDGRLQIWRVDSFHGELVRLVPVPRTGRIVHPDRVTLVSRGGVTQS